MVHYSKISLLITLCIFFVLCMSGCSSSGSSSSGGAQKEQVIPVQEVKITGSAEIFIGHEPVQFVAEVIPSDATFNEVTWTSSDEWVAVVDETGKVSASDKPGAYPGTAVITATAGGVSSTFEVTVKEVPVEQVKITGYENVTVNGKTTLGIHDILQLQASILPADASCQDILWTSSNMEVALVDANGRVENGNQTGPVTITAAAVDKSNQPCGEKASVSIDVEFVPNGTEIPVSEIKIKGYDEMGVEGKVTFKAEFFPANATDNTITWSSRAGYYNRRCNYYSFGRGRKCCNYCSSRW